MGSSPAPHLANGWLSQFESTIRGKAALYSRYMDDIIWSIETNNIDSHLAMINSIHPNLTFTHEIPKDGRLPFLDMEIINTNGVLSSKWYRKPTDTGLTLNYHSLAPLKYKIQPTKLKNKTMTILIAILGKRHSDVTCARRFFLI